MLGLFGQSGRVEPGILIVALVIEIPEHLAAGIGHIPGSEEVFHGQTVEENGGKGIGAGDGGIAAHRGLIARRPVGTGGHDAENQADHQKNKRPGSPAAISLEAIHMGKNWMVGVKGRNPSNSLLK